MNKIRETLENMDGQLNVLMTKTQDIPYEGGSVPQSVWNDIVEGFRKRRLNGLVDALKNRDLAMKLFNVVERTENKAVFLIGKPGVTGQVVRWTYELV